MQADALRKILAPQKLTKTFGPKTGFQTQYPSKVTGHEWGESALQVSIVVPTFNDGDRAITSLKTLDQYLALCGYTYELILVDDGSRVDWRVDEAKLPKSATLLQLERNRGKGYAVRQGMLAASGEVRLFLDCDLAYDLRSIPPAVEAIKSGSFHFVAGDRTHPHSHHQGASGHRRILSVFFRKALNTLIIGSVFDSQCGFKAFSGSLAEKLFSVSTIDRFAFDVELYYLILRYKLPFKVIPVFLKSTGDSRVRLGRDGWRAIVDCLRVPCQWYWGVYPRHCLLDLCEKPPWKPSKSSVDCATTEIGWT